MPVEAISSVAQPQALKEASQFLPKIETIKKVAIGTALVCVGAALMIDGAANQNNAEMFVGGFMLGYGLSVLLG